MDIKIKNGLLYRFFKRFFDILISFIFLILFGWFILILLLIKFIEDGHNPIYKSIRVGYKGKLIKFHKIRSMKYNSEDLKEDLIDQGLNERDDKSFKIKDDPRVTKFGKFLRKTSLDELPELFCILIGKMSFVGPRPLLVEYLAYYTKEEHHRHDVRPGLTGYAQCHGRNSLSWKEKFEMDVWYTRHISLFGDIGILFRTVLSVFKREGISSETSATMEEFMGNDE